MSEDYEVLKQAEIVDLTGDGLPVKAQQITFKSLPSGTIATVNIPLDSFTADAARTAIEARRNVIEATHAL